MGLRGKQPDEVIKRLKLLVFGKAGAGKTTFGMSFPSPYVIDGEKGAENPQYLELLKKNGGVLFQCSDFHEVRKELLALLTEKHPYKTLVIDPLTAIWNDLLDKTIKASNKVDPTAYGAHIKDARVQQKELIALLLRLDMNVIITAHSKNKYSQNMTFLGNTFDADEKLEYLFDLVLEVEKLGRTRTGKVIKTRIKTFDEMEEFPFSYAVIAEKYSRDVLEKDCEPEQLATSAQLAEFDRLINLLKVPDDVLSKWCEKSECSSFEEMNTEHIANYIKLMQEKINSKGK